MQSVRLSDEYVTYLLMMLRNTNRPLSTRELSDAVRQRASS